MPSHLLVPIGDLKQGHLLFKRHRPRIARAIRGVPDALHRRPPRYELLGEGSFIELYPADAP
jgi:hypothetical protein